MSGPFAILMSFISEFHGKKHRDRAMLNIGRSFSFGQMVLPILAYFVLPNHWHWVIVEKMIGNLYFRIYVKCNFGVIWYYSFYVELRIWQIFLFLCSLPTIASLILVCFFPESPKFLMSRGRNEEAMAVFRRVYRINTGEPESKYPVRVFFYSTNLSWYIYD